MEKLDIHMLNIISSFLFCTEYQNFRKVSKYFQNISQYGKCMGNFFRETEFDKIEDLLKFSLKNRIVDQFLCKRLSIQNNIYRCIKCGCVFSMIKDYEEHLKLNPQHKNYEKKYNIFKFPKSFMDYLNDNFDRWVTGMNALFTMVSLEDSPCFYQDCNCDFLHYTKAWENKNLFIEKNILLHTQYGNYLLSGQNSSSIYWRIEHHYIVYLYGTGDVQRIALLFFNGHIWMRIFCFIHSTNLYPILIPIKKITIIDIN